MSGAPFQRGASATISHLPYVARCWVCNKATLAGFRKVEPTPDSPSLGRKSWFGLGILPHLTRIAVASGFLSTEYEPEWCCTAGAATKVIRLVVARRIPFYCAIRGSMQSSA
eukprot:56223-Amphidinium_carterae.1